MAKEKSSNVSVTLKRNVTIKTIVTESFKKFLIFELNQAITGFQARIRQIDGALKKQEGSNDYIRQMQLEKRQQEVNIEDLKNKIEKAKDLKPDSLFVQGVVEGFASIKEGDNLYQKLGAMEIILKDGIVQDIKIVDKYKPE